MLKDPNRSSRPHTTACFPSATASSKLTIGWPSGVDQSGRSLAPIAAYSHDVSSCCAPRLLTSLHVRQFSLADQLHFSSNLYAWKRRRPNRTGLRTSVIHWRGEIIGHSHDFCHDNMREQSSLWHENAIFYIKLCRWFVSLSYVHVNSAFCRSVCVSFIIINYYSANVGFYFCVVFEIRRLFSIFCA